MKTIAYSKHNLQKTAFGGPALAVVALMFLDQFDTFMTILLLIGVAIFFAAAVQAVRKLMGDRAALRYDRDRLTINTMWSETTVHWRDVTSVGTSALNTYGMFGLIKVASTKFLDIKVKGGLFGKKYRLLSDMLELDAAGLALLLDDLAAHADAAAGRVAQHPEFGAAMSHRIGTVEEAPQAPAAFDPDAAFARYMQRRDAPPEPAPLSASAILDRRRDPLEGAPRTELVSPSARAFGRKGL